MRDDNEGMKMLAERFGEQVWQIFQIVEEREKKARTKERVFSLSKEQKEPSP
jgi:hypothetical protein